MSKVSAHFPRITKHDLEVVVEAMDKLREAIAAAQPPKQISGHECNCYHRLLAVCVELATSAGNPDLSELESQELLDESRIWQKAATHVSSVAQAAQPPEVPAEQPRCSHGELVEKLEGRAAD